MPSLEQIQCWRSCGHPAIIAIDQQSSRHLPPLDQDLRSQPVMKMGSAIFEGEPNLGRSALGSRRQRFDKAINSCSFYCLIGLGMGTLIFGIALAVRANCDLLKLP